MEQYKLTTPVVLFFFLRVDSTMAVLSEIRKAKPEKIYLVGEGHRPERIGEEQKVLALRTLVESSIDWDCQVFKNYVPEDIGAGKRISSGISWVFETENKAIFLEDDVIPSQSFFRYCQEMLTYYENDRRIMAISGNNPIPNYSFSGDYTFSFTPLIWGWATWRRAWQNYDFNVKKWPEVKKNHSIEKLFPNRIFYQYRVMEFDNAYRGITYTWDYQFAFHALINSGLCVVPKMNMVKNVGMGPDATNNKSKVNTTMGEANEIEFPIQFKNEVIRDFGYDEYYFKHFIFKSYYSNPLFRIAYHIKRMIPKKIAQYVRDRR